MMIYHAPNNDFSINIKVAASADKKDKSLLLTQPIDNTINIETNCRPKVTMLNRLSSTRTKSEKRVHFHAHFHASRMMLTDKPNVTAYRPRAPMSAKLIQVDHVIEDVSSDSCRGRIIAQEDDDDIDLLAAIAKADCVVRNEYNR